MQASQQVRWQGSPNRGHLKESSSWNWCYSCRYLNSSIIIDPDIIRWHYLDSSLHSSLSLNLKHQGYRVHWWGRRQGMAHLLDHLRTLPLTRWVRWLHPQLHSFLFLYQNRLLRILDGSINKGRTYNLQIRCWPHPQATQAINLSIHWWDQGFRQWCCLRSQKASSQPIERPIQPHEGRFTRQPSSRATQQGRHNRLNIQPTSIAIAKGIMRSSLVDNKAQKAFIYFDCILSQV